MSGSLKSNLPRAWKKAWHRGLQWVGGAGCRGCALGLGPGDEVILPTFTIISCAAAILRAGAMPVLVDCDPMTWNMQARQVEARLTSRTKAIMLVHIFGLPVDMDPILNLAAGRGIAISKMRPRCTVRTYKGRPCGSFGDISTFSFYPNKHVTTGEGGMILTDVTIWRRGVAACAICVFRTRNASSTKKWDGIFA